MESVRLKVIHSKGRKYEVTNFQIIYIIIDEIAVHCYRNGLNRDGNIDKVDFKKGLYVV